MRGVGSFFFMWHGFQESLFVLEWIKYSLRYSRLVKLLIVINIRLSMFFFPTSSSFFSSSVNGIAESVTSRFWVCSLNYSKWYVAFVLDCVESSHCFQVPQVRPTATAPCIFCILVVAKFHKYHVLYDNLNAKYEFLMVWPSRLLNDSHRIPFVWSAF